MGGCNKQPFTVYPKKHAHGFVVLCFVVVTQSIIMNSHEVFIHIHQGCFAGTGAIVRLPQCQWSKPDGYGKISQCITTTKHSKAKTVCIFLGIYCTWGQLVLSSFSFEYTHYEKIAKVIIKIIPKSSSGSDGQSSKLLKSFGNVLAATLSVIMNNFLHTGIFSDKLEGASLTVV